MVTERGKHNKGDVMGSSESLFPGDFEMIERGRGFSRLKGVRAAVGMKDISLSPELTEKCKAAAEKAGVIGIGNGRFLCARIAVKRDGSEIMIVFAAGKLSGAYSVNDGKIYSGRWAICSKIAAESIRSRLGVLDTGKIFYRFKELSWPILILEVETEA